MQTVLQQLLLGQGLAVCSLDQRPVNAGRRGCLRCWGDLHQIQCHGLGQRVALLTLPGQSTVADNDFGPEVHQLALERLHFACQRLHLCRAAGLHFHIGQHEGLMLEA